MLKTYATLALKEEGPQVLVVTLNRPEVLNAISTQMGRDWLDLFNGLAADPGEVRCIVLTGAGERAFCAGADLKERADKTKEWVRERRMRAFAAYDALEALPFPVVSAVHGAAMGAGVEIEVPRSFGHAAEVRAGAEGPLARSG